MSEAFDSKKYVGLVYGPTGQIVAIFGNDDAQLVAIDCTEKWGEVRNAWNKKDGTEPIWELYVRERDCHGSR